VVIGKLIPLNDSNSLTWKQGKTQIRALLRESNIKAVGTFRQRKENNKEYRLGVPGGVAVAKRAAGADVRIVLEAPATEAPSASEVAEAVRTMPDLIPVERAGDHAGALAEIEAVNARIRELKGPRIKIAKGIPGHVEFPNS
jgi:hypothetical protein